MTANANSSTTIAVMWHGVPPIDQNGIITIYEVMYTPNEDFGGAIETKTTNVTELSVLLRDLEENINYSISVLAYTSVGPGPNSVPVIILTNEDGRLLTRILELLHKISNSTVPANPPRNVTATANSSTSIIVMWEEVVPIGQNGAITIYEVMYTPLEVFAGAIGTGVKNVTSHSSSVVVNDLEEYVFYNISVRAYTQVGHGKFSSPITERTNEDGKVLISSLSLYKCIFGMIFVC